MPKRIRGLYRIRVVAIAAGAVHSMALTDEGYVFSFGLGWHGQLGHGDSEAQLKPKMIDELIPKRVVAIAAGGLHSLVLTAYPTDLPAAFPKGEVLSFGERPYGQLGHNMGHTQKPSVVWALRGVSVAAIAAGGRHSMVLTDEGAVLSFGYGGDGQLGHGDRKRCQHEPKYIDAYNLLNPACTDTVHNPSS